MKTLFKNTFDFYLHTSFHVSIATSALVISTYLFANIKVDWHVVLFVFCGTLISYNFIKYFAIFQTTKRYTIKQKILALIIILASVLAIICFIKFNYYTQIITLFFGMLSIFYALPVSKEKPNLRSISGIKIYIVALCWAGITLLLPLYQAEIPLTLDVFAKFLQRFLLVLILILIFEISDLKYDDIRLKTVPQSIGITPTKYLIYLLLLPFYFLEFFKNKIYPHQWLVNLILVTVIVLFTYHASPKKNKYYTLFWVESVPILWLAMIYLFKNY